MNLDDFRRDNPKFVDVFAKLKDAAEYAKLDLTKTDNTDICVNNLFDGYDFTYNLTRDKFKEISESLVKYTFNVSRNLLDQCHLDDGDIDKIILVGGSSLSPIVQEFIRDEFDIEIESSLNPLTVVSN